MVILAEDPGWINHIHTTDGRRLSYSQYNTLYRNNESPRFPFDIHASVSDVMSC